MIEIKTAEIKNVRSCQGRDGIAWSGTLYINGKRSALVRDSGNGGCVHFDWTYSGHGFHGGEIAKAFDDYAASQPPIPADEKYGLPEMKLDADMYVGRLADEYEENKTIRRLCKKNILCRTPDGQTLKFACQPTPDNIQAIQDRHPTYTILNP